jgi:hypothetical protein
MSPSPLVRRDLDAGVCDLPGCTHDTHPDGLALHARCHPAAPLQVWYADGLLTVKCNTCKGHVCRIAVASVLLGSVH